MNQTAETGENNVIDDVELEDAEGEENVGNDENTIADESDAESESAPDDVVVSIGEEPPPQEDKTHAPEWVRELRKANREKERKIRELEARLQTTTTETKPVVLGAKPKLEDHDYDSEVYEQALENWYERKKQVEAQAQASQQAEQAQRQAWQSRLDAYGKAKAELKVRDFEDAEVMAQEVLNVTQQGIVVQGADNPALVIYALGKNPKKAQEIASIKDPVKFAFAVAKLEKELKVTNRRAAPPPERTIQGTGRVSGAVDSTLERLRADAEKTGNYTKVLQYKRQKQSAKS
jgi:hypothetical protein